MPLFLTVLMLGLLSATPAGRASDLQTRTPKAPVEYRPSTHVPVGEAVAFPADI